MATIRITQESLCETADILEKYADCMKDILADVDLKLGNLYGDLRGIEQWCETLRRIASPITEYENLLRKIAKYLKQMAEPIPSKDYVTDIKSQFK